MEWSYAGDRQAESAGLLTAMSQVEGYLKEQVNAGRSSQSWYWSEGRLNFSAPDADDENLRLLLLAAPANRIQPWIKDFVN